MKARNTAILIFNDVEVLDFAGPFEVFNAANHVLGQTVFNVFTISEGEKNIIASNGLKVTADFNFADSPAPDIVIIPGGVGRKIQMNNPAVLNWLQKVLENCEQALSVCTGSFILGKAELLKGLNATTHHDSFKEFEETFTDTRLIRNMKYVDSGKIVTAGGISAGINMSLYVLDKLLGNGTGKLAAEYMEYDR